MKHHIFKKLVLTLLLSVTSTQVMAVGALAIDSNQGSAYGYAVDYDNSYDARNGALRKCGRGCSVVVDFDSGCAAYAADQTAGSTAYGWSKDYPTRSAAEGRALNECENNGGANCVIRVWGCNSQ